MTTAQQVAPAHPDVDMDGPVIAHVGFKEGDQYAFCGARILGVKVVNPERRCADCKRIAEELERRLGEIS